MLLVMTAVIVQSQRTVAAYFASKQLLSVGIARQAAVNMPSGEVSQKNLLK